MTMNIYLKTLISIMVGMGAALGLALLFVSGNDASKETIIARVSEAQKALPKIVQEDKELMLFFGSSMVGAGFSARQFDSELQQRGKDNIKSFNLGFGGLNPFFQDYFARRVRDEFVKADRKAKLVVIEFNPFQASKTRWQRAKSIVDSYITMLATDEELFEIAKDDLQRGIRLFNIKYLRNDISAQMITSYYGNALFPSKRSERLPEPEELVKRRKALGKQLNEAFEKEYPDYKGEAWSYEWQGAGTIPEERSAETLALFKQYYDTFLNDVNLQNKLNGRIQSADILEMNFEPLMIESFIRIVKSFEQIADKVEIVMLPRNTKWVKYTEQGQQRLNDAIAQIEAKTGLIVKNHQTISGIDETSFSDATHLARYRGDVRYTSYLVEQYADVL
jgi:hypothetical protein